MDKRKSETIVVEFETYERRGGTVVKERRFKSQEAYVAWLMKMNTWPGINILKLSIETGN